MAGEIISGGGEDLNAPEFPEMIHIETKNFTATAIPLYSMPGTRVMAAMGAEDIQQKMWMMFELFAVSLNGEDALDRLGMVDYSELNEAVALWIRKSNEQRTQSLQFVIELD